MQFCPFFGGFIQRQRLFFHLLKHLNSLNYICHPPYVAKGHVWSLTLKSTTLLQEISIKSSWLPRHCRNALQWTKLAKCWFERSIYHRINLNWLTNGRILNFPLNLNQNIGKKIEPRENIVIHQIYVCCFSLITLEFYCEKQHLFYTWTWTKTLLTLVSNLLKTV